MVTMSALRKGTGRYEMMKNEEIELKLISTTSKWYGITYKEDLENFKQAIKNMVKEGKYPKHLYN